MRKATLRAAVVAGAILAASALGAPAALAQEEAVPAPTGVTDNYSDYGIFMLEWQGSVDSYAEGQSTSYEIYADSRLVDVVSGYSESAVVCLDPGTYTFTVRTATTGGATSAPSDPVEIAG